jgi:hypothetical protein
LYFPTLPDLFFSNLSFDIFEINNIAAKLSSLKAPYLKLGFYVFGDFLIDFEGCATVIRVIGSAFFSSISQ